MPKSGSIRPEDNETGTDLTLEKLTKFIGKFNSGDHFEKSLE